VTFFIDNCLPPKWATALDALFSSDGYHFVALRDKFKPDTEDTVWLPMLAAETTEWVVITSDEKIAKRPQEIVVWQRSGLPTFFLKGWEKHDFHKMHAAIVRRVPEFVDHIRTMGGNLGFRVPITGGIVPFYRRLPTPPAR
jgi:hypothetical protein